MMAPAEDRPRGRGDRKVERAKEKFNRWIKWVILIGLALAVVVVYTLAFHTVTQSDAQSAACKSLDRAMDIQLKFVQHLERKSIENVEAGVTSSTTSVPEIHRFFTPTIEEIKRTHC